MTSLLLDARDGDRAAFAAVVQAMQADVWRLVTHLVGSAEAEDVMQDVFVRVWRSLPGYRVEASARTWIVAIARRACVDAVRRMQRHRRLLRRAESSIDVVDAHIATDPTGNVDVEALVVGLDHDRREAFVLTQVLGFSYEETARMCGVPIGTVRSRVSRARADLRARLGPHASDTA